TRVTKAIADGEFFDNQAICAAVDQAVSAGRAVHIMGLVSPGGVHSHEDHIVAMVELAARRRAGRVQRPAFLNGRDTPPRSAELFPVLLEQAYHRLGKGRTARLTGRYLAMGRDNRWDRVEAAYIRIAEGQGLYRADSAAEGLKAA